MRMRYSDGNYEDFTKRKQKPQIFTYIILSLFTLCCLLPLVLVVIISFTSQDSIYEKGYSFFPSAWSLDAYRYVAEFGSQLVRSYKITILETVLGTVLTLIVSGMFAYVLSRKDFMLRKALVIYMLVAMLTAGGLLSSYIINTTVYHLKDNFLILILPGCLAPGNVIIMRTYIQSNIPDSLIESGYMDGAGELTIFFRIVLPLMKPSVASIAFMVAVGHWNQWQTSMLYINDAKLTPLQLLLMRIEKEIDFLYSEMQFMTQEQLAMLGDLPDDPARMAILLATLGPIMVIYPFFQKHFTKGMTVGSVKG